MNEIFCISRTDSIGDVVLTLPMVGYLKSRFPKAKIIFLGRNYTKPIIEMCGVVDEVILFDQIEEKSTKELASFFQSKEITHFIHVFPVKKIAKAAKLAKINHRIGTSHRLFHLTTCNERINFTRRNSELHESQLNFHLLKTMGLKFIPSIEEVVQYLDCLVSRKEFDKSRFGIDSRRPVVILHPKSKGSAVEWGIPNFIQLIEFLKPYPVEIIVSGTEEESNSFRSLIPKAENVKDISGKLTLVEFIDLIASSNALVAASTGPLHIAGILGLHAVGLFCPKRPIHPQRWKPLGSKATYFVKNEHCESCTKGKECLCIQNISPELVGKYLIETLTIITS
ncbi:MAG: glycosyltransferase family 9 protein [Crocinitomicaceae bacterium]